MCVRLRSALTGVRYPEQPCAISIGGRMSRRDQLICEIDRLEGHLPKRAVRFLSAVLNPKAAWLRVPLALVLMVGGGVGFFLPVPAFWMLPLRLALLALHVPFMRRPMTRILAFINGKLGA